MNDSIGKIYTIPDSIIKYCVLDIKGMTAIIISSSSNDIQYWIATLIKGDIEISNR